MGLMFLVGIAGGIVGRMVPFNGGTTPVVHAQSAGNETANCIIAVPNSWGVFMGASDFGIAFQDQKGAIRFVAHPSCANMNAPTDVYAVDLKVVRK